MTTKQMSEPQMARFSKSMQEQGVGVLRTKKGLLLRLPNGESTAVHFTNSDVRAQANLIARLRRAGVRHPEDKQDVASLPKQITTGSVAPSSRRKLLEAMKELNYPDSVRVQEIRDLTGMEHVTTARALYALGFVPAVGKRNARNWMTPPELLDQRVVEKPEEEPQPEPITTPEVEPEEQPANPHFSEPEPESPTFQENGEATWIPAPTRPYESDVRTDANGREFIDSFDSWVVDLTQVPAPVGKYIRLLQAAGLQAEIRVWRQREEVSA